jgi:hypothetical protein
MTELLAHLAPPAARVAAPRRTLDGDAAYSLLGLDTTQLVDGCLCYVQGEKSYYILDKESAAAPSPPDVIPALKGGNWLVFDPGDGSGDDPVEVHSLADLPAPVGGVITLAADTRYEFIGRVVIGTNELLLSDGTHIVGRAGIIRNEGSSGAILRMPAAGRVVIERIGLDMGGGNVVQIGGDVDSLFKDVSFFNTTGGGTVAALLVGNNVSPVTGGSAVLIDCQIADYTGVACNGGTLDALEIVNCQSEGRLLLLDSDSTTTRIFLSGNVYRGSTGNAVEAVAGATVGLAQAVSNQFGGPGPSYDADAAQLFSPIEVWTPADAAVQATNVTYLLMTDVDASIVMQDGCKLIGRGTRLRASTPVGFINYTDIFIEGVILENTGSNWIFSAGGVSPGSTLTLRNCHLVSAGRGAQINGVDNLIMENVRITVGNASWAGISFTAGFVTAVAQLNGCTFDGAGDGIDHSSGITNILVNDCVFDVAAGQFGINSTSGVTAGRLNGNAFVGAGTPLSGVAGPTWQARGNIGVADF